MAEMNEASLAFWLSKFVGFREFRVMCNQNESVVSPVFNNCNITFRLWGGRGRVFIDLSDVWAD
jgi:hypothetical protein